MFSHRTEHESTKSALECAVKARYERGASIIDLTLSNPTRADLDLSSDFLSLDDLAANVDELKPLGLLAARQAIASDWAALGVSIAPGDVVLTASRIEAYSFLLAMLCDPEDEILVPAPGFPYLERLARISDIHISEYPLHYDGDRWVLDPALVFDAISERTRAIVIGNPHYPTGASLDRECAEAIDALGLPIISDEIFAHYPLETRSTSMLGATRESLCFALGALDESAARPQMKLAWIGIGGPEELVAAAKERLELLSQMFLSVNAPVQVAVPHWLASASRVRDAIRARCTRNLARLRELTRDAAIEVPAISGGWWACLRIHRELTDEELALALLERDGVLVRPGQAFDFPSHPPWLAVSLLTPEPTFETGIRAIVNRVATQ